MNQDENEFDPKELGVGRPSKYQIEYCEVVVALGKTGKSLAQMASHFDVGRTTIDRWSDDHGEFREALTRATTHAQAWWEDQAQLNLSNKEFQTPLWKKTMEARFRNDYTERREETNMIKTDSSLAAVMSRIAENGRHGAAS